MNVNIDFFVTIVEIVVVLLVLYGIMWIWILPMNRVRIVSDNLGFAHIQGGGRNKRDMINRLRKTRFEGKIPPAFPNGWYALAESREVKYGVLIRGKSLLELSCGYHFSSRLTATLNICLIYFKIT